MAKMGSPAGDHLTPCTILSPANTYDEMKHPVEDYPFLAIFARLATSII